MQSLELARELETTVTYASWKWNLDSYQQYYTAYPLVVESIVHPMHHNSDRIWGILDFVFGSCPFLSNESKILGILQSLLVAIPKLHLRLGINPANCTPSGSTRKTSSSGLDDEVTEFAAEASEYEQIMSYSGNESISIDWVSSPSPQCSS